MQCHITGITGNFRGSIQLFDLIIQEYFYLVSRLQILQIVVTILFFSCYLSSVYQNPVTAAPVRPSDCHLSAAFCDLILHFKFIRIPCLTLQHHSIFKGNPALHKQMYKGSPLIFTVSILAKRGNAPCHIGRTAGTGIPARTLGQIMSVCLDLSGNAGKNFQRIDIEKPLSVQLHSRQHRIIKGSFHHICVFGIHFRLQHSGGKEH